MPGLQRLLSVPLGISALIGFSSPVLAVGELLPFRAEPNAYAAWLNQQQWGGGSQLVFFNLYGCKYNDDRLLNVYSSRAIEADKKQEEIMVELNSNVKKTESGWTSYAYSSDERQKMQKQAESLAALRDKYQREDGYPYQSYSCNGYIQITNPKGRWVCDMTVTYMSNSLRMNNQGIDYPINKGDTQYRYNNCVMQF